MAYAPFMDSVTSTTSAQQLSALIAAIDARVATLRMAAVRIELNAGATGTLFVGGSNVAAAHCGANLAAGAAVFIQPGEADQLILLTDIWILASTGTQQVNVTLFPKGM